MLTSKNKKYILNKYNIDTDKYSDTELQELLEKIISRNDRIIKINYQKISLLNEINNDIDTYLNRGK